MLVKREKTPLTKTRLLAAGLAAAVLASGCTAAPSTTTAPTTAGATASMAPASAGPADARPGADVDATALLDQVGTAAAAMKSTHLELKTTGAMSGQSFSMNMSGDLDLSDPAQPRSSMTMSGLLEMSMVVDAGVYYLKLPALGDGWYKATKAQLEQAGGGAIPDAAEQAKQYEFLDGKVERAVYVGEENVGGVATRHYTLSVRQAAITGVTPTASPSASAVETVPYELFVDAQGFVRRTLVTTTDPQLTIEVLLTAINQPVTITAPANAQEFPT